MTELEVGGGDYIRPGQVNPLQAYQRHIVSEHLVDRHPYLEDIRGHLKADDVSVAFGNRQFPRLIEQLKSSDISAEKLAEALRTICDLVPNQESKCQAVAADVVAAAADLLTHEDTAVKREAAKTIAAIALMLNGRSRMPTLNAGPAVPKLSRLLLTCNDEGVKANVADAFNAICVFRDGCQQVVDQGAVKAMASYLCVVLPEQPQSQLLAVCFLSLLKALSQVTMYANNGLRDLIGCGLIGKLCVFLSRVPPGQGIPVVTPEQSTETVRQALRVIWHIGNDMHGRQEALKAKGVEVITAFLNDQDAKVREGAVCALNVLSLEIPGKKDILQHSVVPLAELLHSERETQYLTETCVQLCRCASELPAFRFTFAKHVLESIWLLEKIYGVTSIAAVYGLIADVDPRIRILAVLATRHFLTKTPPARGDEIRVPPVCPLERIDSPAMFAFEECTGILHNLLYLLGESMPQDAQGAALDCLEVLTSEVKAQQELLEVLQSGERPVAAGLLPMVQGMCQKKAKVAEPKAAPAPAAEGPCEAEVLAYRAEGELLKFEKQENCAGSSLGSGVFEWNRQEEHLVSGSYSVDAGNGIVEMIISTIHYRGDGQDDFQEIEPTGNGLMVASFAETEDVLEIGPCDQWPDLQSIRLQKDH
jgi:hypothetical protein